MTTELAAFTHRNFTGTHSHAHAAFGAEGHVIHDHQHNDDADHNHRHTLTDDRLAGYAGEEPSGAGVAKLSMPALTELADVQRKQLMVEPDPRRRVELVGELSATKAAIAQREAQPAPPTRWTRVQGKVATAGRK